MFVIGFGFVISASKTHLHAACEGKSRTILALGVRFAHPEKNRQLQGTISPSKLQLICPLQGPCLKAFSTQLGGKLTREAMHQPHAAGLHKANGLA